MKAAAIFDNFGPYHLARLEAAAGVCDLLAIQVHARSAEYAWDSGPATGGLRIATLFQFPRAGAGWGERTREPSVSGTLPDLNSLGDTVGSSVASPHRSELDDDISASVSKELMDFEPDVVFVPGWSSRTAFAALQWCARQGVPVVGMSESTAWDEKRRAWREAVKRRVVGLCSSALVGGSPHADYMVSLGMARERVFLGYDAVDNGHFAAGAAEARGQRSEGGERHTSPGVPPPSPQSGEGQLPEKFFLASARFVEKKNLPRLIEAYARYRELAWENQISTPHPNPLPDRGGEGMGDGHATSQSTLNPQPSTALWSLVLLGDGPLRTDLCRLISDLGLQSSVSMPGFKQYPDLPAYYGLAGAFIHASTTEQWGLVVNEAMASGLPALVSNRCGCAKDLVQEGVNGFTFDPYDIEGLAKLMLKLSTLTRPAGHPLPSDGRGAGGEGSLERMGRASKEIIANWGPERFASGLKAAAECALKVGPKRAGLFDRLLLNAMIRR